MRRAWLLRPWPRHGHPVSGRNPARTWYDGEERKCFARNRRWRRPGCRGCGSICSEKPGANEKFKRDSDGRLIRPRRASGGKTASRRASPPGLLACTAVISPGRPGPACGPPKCGPISSMMFSGERSIQRSNGPDCNWSKPLVPGDRDFIGPCPACRSQVVLQTLVDWCEQEIVADADLDPLSALGSISSVHASPEVAIGFSSRT